MNPPINNILAAFRQRLTLIGCGVLIAVAGGCANYNGTLVVDSGPPVAQVRGRQAMEEPVYAVHAGERARLKFTWRMDT